MNCSNVAHGRRGSHRAGTGGTPAHTVPLAASFGPSLIGSKPSEKRSGAVNQQVLLDRVRGHQSFRPLGQRAMRVRGGSEQILLDADYRERGSPLPGSFQGKPATPENLLTHAWTGARRKRFPAHAPPFPVCCSYFDNKEALVAPDRNRPQIPHRRFGCRRLGFGQKLLPASNTFVLRP